MPAVVLMITHVERILSKLDTTDVITTGSATEFRKANFSLFVLNCIYSEGPSIASERQGIPQLLREPPEGFQNFFQGRNHT